MTTKQPKANGTAPQNSDHRPLFAMGNLYIAARAREVLTNGDIFASLCRHTSGDWGNCCAHDRRQNELALLNGSRLFSVYRSRRGVKFWVITEADRSATTVLLPDEY